MDNLIRSERDQRGSTRAALAEPLRVPPQIIVALENGTNDPSLPLTSRISRRIDTPNDGLIFPVNDS